MPDQTFEVETYTVTVRGITNTGIPRRISISSPAAAHGIRTRANLNFWESDPSNKGNVRNVGGLNFDGITINANMKKSDYDHIYHLLQTEKPVKVRYFYSSAGDTTTKSLSALYVFSGDEFPGEGDEDDSP